MATAHVALQCDLTMPPGALNPCCKLFRFYEATEYQLPSAGVIAGLLLWWASAAFFSPAPRHHYRPEPRRASPPHPISHNQVHFRAPACHCPGTHAGECLWRYQCGSSTVVGSARGRSIGHASNSESSAATPSCLCLKRPQLCTSEPQKHRWSGASVQTEGTSLTARQNSRRKPLHT